SLRDRFLAGEARRVDWGAVPGVFADKRVCFIVHGFNVDRDHGYAGYGAMAQELLGLGPALNLPPVAGADLVIPILWPGDWHLPAINYPFEMGDVRETGRRFGAFLRGPAAQAASFAFVSHSLGARVVLETITQAVLSGPPPQATFELAILSAPAADQDELDNPRYHAGVKVLERIMVVSSPDDEVLGFAYPAGNIIEAALWRGEKARARALEMFRKVRMPAAEKRLDDYPHQLSGGMRQRVMIAMALANDPDLLIADEPTTALDVTIQAQILELVRDLRQKLGMAIVWITHDLGVIAGIADRVMVMYGGQVVEMAPVRELFARPMHPYTKALLQTIPALHGARDARLKTIEGQPPILRAAPVACPFLSRCAHAVPICALENPPRRTLTPGLDAACHRAEELAVIREVAHG
ncbi:MAG: ATP-binding cassette domain-containing protein, partial [Brevundimonas sp.]|uniref:ABC transporter ATP-binding protein n=1 Tax=Brevundimonas sp. TaxID=1871086 RepID=UPI002735D94F